MFNCSSVILALESLATPFALQLQALALLKSFSIVSENQTTQLSPLSRTFKAVIGGFSIAHVSESLCLRRFGVYVFVLNVLATPQAISFFGSGT
jgi:hypothetical protein